ncbi:MAG: hypothetical protein GY725_03735 [bacterium]|nr:hypothetical protein [bacterium]
MSHLIASCPQCNSRYRIAREKISAAGARIRCSRCETIFRVESPGPRPVESDPPVAQPAAPQPVPAQVPAAPQTEAPAFPSPSQAEAPAISSPGQAEAPADPSLQQSPATVPTAPTPPVPARPKTRVLVAEGDSDVAKKLATFLTDWGLDPEVVHDGGEALLRLFRNRPKLAVLGGHLPGVSSVVLAEVLRRSADLQDMTLIRVAPMDEPAGAPEFDANHTLEPGDLPDGLAALLETHGLGARPTPEPELERPVAPAPEPPSEPVAVAPTPAPETPAVSEKSSPGQQAPMPGSPTAPEAEAKPRRRRRPPPLSDDPEIAAAERLARIAVSDVILYNEEKFADAVKQGNVADSMAADIQEARHHFNQRIPEEVRSKKDYLIEELERRASIAASA